MYRIENTQSKQIPVLPFGAKHLKPIDNIHAHRVCVQKAHFFYYSIHKK